MTRDVVTRIKLDTSSIPPAAAQAGRAIGGIARDAQTSSRQATAAMRQLPAQFTDIATQLAGGQNIGLILLQQGGQIRDSFGSAGAAIRGITSVITPARLALGGVAGALATVAAGAYQGARESAALRDTLILTGNAAGLTETRMAGLVQRISTTTGQSAGEVRQLVTALAASGRVSGQVLESTAAAVARVAELSGKSAEDIAGQFTGLLRDPARVAAELNQQYNFLSESLARRIRQLSDEGRKVEAANLVNKALTEALDGQTRQLGYLETAWADAGKAVSAFWENVKAVGRPQTVEQAIEASRKQLATLQQRLAREPAGNAFGAVNPGRAQLEQAIAREELRLAGLAERVKQENAAADAAAARAANAGKVAGILTGNPKRDADAARRANAEARRIEAEERAMERAFERADKDVERGFEDALQQIQREQLDQAIGPVLRNTEQQKFLDDLVLDNRRANIELLEDDGQRARAQADLEREMLQRRIDALYEFSEDRAAAEQAADQAWATRMRAIEQREEEFAQRFEQRGRQVFEGVLGESVLAGFQGRFDDIGRMWSNLLQQMAARAAAADLVALVFGGKGGNLAGLFGNFLGILGGGLDGKRAAGGPVSAGGAYLVGERGPELLMMGGRGGSIVPNSRLAGGALSITLAPQMWFDARSDQAQLQALVQAGMAHAQAAMWQQLRARGYA